VPFRARSLLPKRSRSPPPLKGRVDSGGDEDLPAGLHGSAGNAERRIQVPHAGANGCATKIGSRSWPNSQLIINNNNNLVRGYRKVAEQASAMRSRAVYGSIHRCKGLLTPTLVDLPDRDMFIPEAGRTQMGPVMDLKRINHWVDQKPYEVNLRRAAGRPSVWGVYYRLNGDFVLRLINVNHTLTFIHEPKSSWQRSFARNCKAFGPISRDRYYRFYIKLITFFGLSRRDFRNALRIRELWLRGSRAFRKGIFGMIYSYSMEQRGFIAQLPLKGKPKNRDTKVGPGSKTRSRQALRSNA
jgi:hypothetical protein